MTTGDLIDVVTDLPVSANDSFTALRAAMPGAQPTIVATDADRRLRCAKGCRSEMKYSVFSLLREAFRGHTGWTPAWRKAEPKADYDVVIIGGGGHGLATAYYLANEHGITNVAVLEKG